MKVLNDKKRGFLSRLITTVIVVLLIFMVGLWFIARTDDGRRFVEKRLSRMAGMPVTIGEMRIGWPYQLVMDNVRTKEFEAAGTAGFSLAEARLWRGLHRWHLSLDQLLVRIKRAGDGTEGWEPKRMARIADLREARIPDIIRLTRDLRDKFVLRVASSEVSWLEPDGVEAAFARDVDFRMIPVKVDQRRFFYYYLNIYNSANIAFPDRRDLHLEWLATDGLAYIELPGDGVDDDAVVDTVTATSGQRADNAARVEQAPSTVSAKGGQKDSAQPEPRELDSTKSAGEESNQ